MKKNSVLGILGMALVFGMMFAACEFSASGSINVGGDDDPDEPSNPTGPLTEGVYVGIISFDAGITEITTAPVSIATGKDSLKKAIEDKYNRGANSGTLLYRAVHEALHSMKGLESRLPTNAQSFNIITFTDGIDVGSTGASLWDEKPLDGQNFGGQSASGYLSWLNGQLESTVIKGYPITASSYGVAGSDVTDQTVFASNLAQLTTSTGQTNTSIDFNQLKETFGDIASSLNVSSTSFVLQIPQGESGTVYKMTFDNIKNEGESQVYFTGTYIYDSNTKTHSLTNIAYVGMDGSVYDAKGTAVGSQAKFDLGTFSLDDGGSIVQSYLQQWVQTDNGSWQRNSEYSNAGSTKVEKSSAVIYLVLDSSRSLTDANVASIKSAAKEFIDVLYTKYTATPLSAAPTNLKATALATDTIQLTWNSVSGAKYYNIYYSDSATSSYYFVDTSSTTSYIDDVLLAANTTYYYKVSGVNAAGEEGPLSASASATTKATDTKADLLRIYNDSSQNIVWIGVWEVAADDWWTKGNASCQPTYYWHWSNGVPVGKRYRVEVKDALGVEAKSQIFLLSKETHLSFDGSTSIKLKN